MLTLIGLAAGGVAIVVIAQLAGGVSDALYSIAAVDLLIAGALADLHRDERLPAIAGAASVLVVLVLLTIVASRRTTVEIATWFWYRVLLWRTKPPADVQRQQASELYDVGRNVLGSRWNRAVLVVLVAGAWLADGLRLDFALIAAECTCRSTSCSSPTASASSRPRSRSSRVGSASPRSRCPPSCTTTASGPRRGTSVADPADPAASAGLPVAGRRHQQRGRRNGVRTPAAPDR